MSSRHDFDHHHSSNPNNESLVSSNKMLIEKMKQQEQRLQQYKHYEKYLQVSPRSSPTIGSSSTTATTNPNDVSLYSNLDELLKDFKREMSTVRSSLEASSASAATTTANTYGQQQHTRGNNHENYLTSTTDATTNYLASATDGMLIDLDFSIDRSAMKPYHGLAHYDHEDPTSPIQKQLSHDTPMKGISPSPFTKLKQADARDFFMSPIITQPHTNRGSHAMASSNNNNHINTNSTNMNHISSTVAASSFSSNPTSSGEAALKLENIQLRNEISKLSSSVVAMQTRMKDLESSVDQILQLLLSGKK